MGKIRFALLTIAVAGMGAAQNSGSESAATARTLRTLLDAQKLDAVAAQDSASSTRFIAALYYPGAQLLVVSADYAVPDQLQQRLAARQFRDAYMDLQGAGARVGKVFVTDLRADGLHRAPEKGEPFDIVYRNGSQHAAYDGDWAAQRVDESDYHRRFARDDGEYAHMLQMLVEALKAPPTPSRVP
jgi:hypothetical protein